MWSRIKYIISGIIFKKPLNSFKMDSKAMLINKIVVDTVCECPFMFYSNGQLVLFRFPFCLYNDMYADVSLMAPSYVAGHTSAPCPVLVKTGLSCAVPATLDCAHASASPVRVAVREPITASLCGSTCLIVACSRHLIGRERQRRRGGNPLLAKTPIIIFKVRLIFWGKLLFAICKCLFKVAVMNKYLI